MCACLSETLAVCLYSEFTRRGLTVWLDIKMGTHDEAAVQEGVQNCNCVVAIVTGGVGFPLILLFLGWRAYRRRRRTPVWGFELHSDDSALS